MCRILLCPLYKLSFLAGLKILREKRNRKFKVSDKTMLSYNRYVHIEDDFS